MTARRRLHRLVWACGIAALLAAAAVAAPPQPAPPYPAYPPPPRRQAPPPSPVPVVAPPPPLSPAMRVLYAPFYAAGLVVRYGVYYLFVAPIEVFSRTIDYGVDGGVAAPPPAQPDPREGRQR